MFKLNRLIHSEQIKLVNQAASRCEQEEIYFTLKNHSIYHESEFSKIETEGYLIRVELDDEPADWLMIDFDFETVTRLVDSSPLDKEAVLHALQKQLNIEKDAFEKGIDYGRSLQQTDIKNVLGL